ncbi:MAG: PorT family protein [Cyclobacteriaceae bacterium]|nr:PorT family protein [Cyclobacteriaceae bacterium]
MKKPHFILLLLACCLSHSMLWAQGKGAKPKPYGNTATAKSSQWWIGVRGGMNVSSATARQSYSVFSYTRAADQGFDEKKYQAFTLPGLQFGFSVSYEFLTGLSANILPAYASYRFAYDNSFRWYDSSNPQINVATSYHVESRLQYIELPFTIKYELMRSKFKPYIQGGAYYGFLTDGLKKVTTTSIDQASGSDTEINETKLSVGIKDRTKKANYGLIGGAGFTYNIGNARLGLEVNYRYGLQNPDNGGMKYIDNQLVSGVYDIPDDYQLNHLELSLQVIIPLKFITSQDYVPL